MKIKSTTYSANSREGQLVLAWKTKKHNLTGDHIEALTFALEWADTHPKPVVIKKEDIKKLAKEVVTKDWQEQQEKLLDMIERNYRAHFMRSACKWLERHLHHDNVGGFWADATSVEEFINQFKSSCSEIPTNLKGVER